MPPSHDLLTPTEHEAAQLLVILARRLDGGQLANADQMLARLCGIPTNDVAMASIVLLREVAHNVAPVLQRPPIVVLDHLRAWLTP
jgi:ornithine cyclodeaminase/alanine dehydrogenase-like protein (mu-crystallin family)